MFIPDDRVEAEIGLDLGHTRARPRRPADPGDWGRRGDRARRSGRFKKLLRLRARHKRLFGTELDAVPPFLRRAWRPSDAHRDQLTAALEAAIARSDVALTAAEPEPVTA